MSKRCTTPKSDIAVTLGWRVFSIDKDGRAVPVLPRVFLVKDAALEYAELARKSGTPSAYVAEVIGHEPANDGKIHRRRAAV